MKLVIEKRRVAGSTGVITYEPGSLPAFEPNENAVVPEKRKSAAKKTAAKKTAARKTTDPSSAPKKRSRKAAAEDEQPIESLLDLLEK